MIDHACESCGAVRQVYPDKIAKGVQKICRKCQGPAAAEKRRASMLKRGGPKPITYGVCKECRKIYETPSSSDDGFCGKVCRGKAESRGYSASAMSSMVLSGLIRPSLTLFDKRKKTTPPGDDTPGIE